MPINITYTDENLGGFSVQAQDVLQANIKAYADKLISESILLSYGDVNNQAQTDVNRQNVQDAARSLTNITRHTLEPQKKPVYYHIPGIISSITGVLLGIFASANPPNIISIIIITLLFGGSLVGNIVAGAKNG